MKGDANPRQERAKTRAVPTQVIKELSGTYSESISEASLEHLHGRPIVSGIEAKDPRVGEKSDKWFRQTF